MAGSPSWPIWFAAPSGWAGAIARRKYGRTLKSRASYSRSDWQYSCQARTPSVIRSWKLDTPTKVSIPASRISSRTTSRTRAKANVIPRLWSALMSLNNSSLALTSVKLTGPKSRSTRFMFGRAASEASNASLTWPMLAKKRSPPIRKISNPGKVIASGWRCTLR